MTDENPKSHQLLSRRDFFRLTGGAIGAAATKQVYDAANSRWVSEAAEAAEVSQLPEVKSVSSVTEMEAHFRAQDNLVLGVGKTIFDYTEDAIRAKRNEKGENKGPHKTTYVISEDEWKLIETQGMDTIGTNDPRIYVMALEATWNKLCLDAGMPSEATISEIIRINDASFTRTIMQYLPSEGNSDSNPWRTHDIGYTGSGTRFEEPLTSDQVVCFTNKHAADGYPLNPKWGALVVLDVDNQSHSVLVDLGMIHELGHTRGKDKDIGTLADWVWLKKYDMSNKLNAVGVTSRINILAFDEHSIMTQFYVNNDPIQERTSPVEFTQGDVFFSQLRAGHLPDYGGVHADGLANITWADGSTSEITNKLDENYTLSYVDRLGNPINDSIVGNTIVNIGWNGIDDPAQEMHVTNVRTDSNSNILLSRNAHEDINTCMYIAPTDSQGRLLPPVPKILMSYLAIQHDADANNPTPITVHLNASKNEILSDLYDPEHGTQLADNPDVDGLRINTFSGVIDPDSVANNPNVIAWATLPMPISNKGTNFITFVWTNDNTYSMQALPDDQVFIPLVINSSHTEAETEVSQVPPPQQSIHATSIKPIHNRFGSDIDDYHKYVPNLYTSID